MKLEIQIIATATRIEIISEGRCAASLCIPSMGFPSAIKLASQIVIERLERFFS